ncbi:unnamed protein product, partial [Strongylus vulgaris]
MWWLLAVPAGAVALFGCGKVCHSECSAAVITSREDQNDQDDQEDQDVQANRAHVILEVIEVTKAVEGEEEGRVDLEDINRV